MGRTGIRGKGTLWRWGPNHLIKAVCTRWRRKYNQENQPSDYLYVEGKRVLEFIATQREGNNLETVYELPGVSATLVLLRTERQGILLSLNGGFCCS